MQSWFEVDKDGLAKLLERRGKQFILYELVQNAWDEATTVVDIQLQRLPNEEARLTVIDDNPAGFKNLAHAFTLFAESDKKGDAEKRGRFNLGEKLVLSLCTAASVTSTKGQVVFDDNGRHETDIATPHGSVFVATLPLTKEEFGDFDEAARRLMPPAGIVTRYNGIKLETRPVLNRIEVILPTELGDPGGVLRPTTRKTVVEIADPLDGEPAALYEMGIPVVEVDMPWHVNVGQKIPLNMDRDNVKPSYLGKVRAVVAENMAEQLSNESANSAWLRDAINRHGDEMSPETINRLANLRFGEKRVIYDPNDPEANALAAARGYTVIHGGAMGKAEWKAFRDAGAILPSSQVTPSPKPFKASGETLRLQDEDKLTDGMQWFRVYAMMIGHWLMGVDVTVRLANDPTWHFMGCYGGRQLTINVAKVGKKWFDGPLAPINEFLIHEYGHEYSGNHLSDEYHDALCRLGGKLSQLALDQPDLFKRG